MFMEEIFLKKDLSWMRERYLIMVKSLMQEFSIATGDRVNAPFRIGEKFLGEFNGNASCIILG